MKKAILPTMFLLLLVNMPAEACVFPSLAKVAIRLPGSAVKASIDTVKMAGFSLIVRLGGYRDPK